MFLRAFGISAAIGALAVLAMQPAPSQSQSKTSASSQQNNQIKIDPPPTVDTNPGRGGGASPPTAGCASCPIYCTRPLANGQSEQYICGHRSCPPCG